jgi:hypothetical protein
VDTSSINRSSENINDEFVFEKFYKENSEIINDKKEKFEKEGKKEKEIEEGEIVDEEESEEGSEKEFEEENYGNDMIEKNVKNTEELHKYKISDPLLPTPTYLSATVSHYVTSSKISPSTISPPLNSEISTKLSSPVVNSSSFSSSSSLSPSPSFTLSSSSSSTPTEKKEVVNSLSGLSKLKYSGQNFVPKSLSSHPTLSPTNTENLKLLTTSSTFTPSKKFTLVPIVFFFFFYYYYY